MVGCSKSQKTPFRDYIEIVHLLCRYLLSNLYLLLIIIFHNILKHCFSPKYAIQDSFWQVVNQQITNFTLPFCIELFSNSELICNCQLVHILCGSSIYLKVLSRIYPLKIGQKKTLFSPKNGIRFTQIAKKITNHQRK